MATTHVDVEEIGMTRSEKLLAVVLAAFILIGCVWAYAKIDDGVRDAVRPDAVSPTPADAAAIERHERAHERLAAAQEARATAHGELELRREAYRTALDAGQPAADLERTYRAAEETFAAAEREVEAAQAEVHAAEPAAAAARENVASAYGERTNRQALLTFLFRMLLVGATLALGYWLLARLRRAASRYFPVAFSLLGAATVSRSCSPRTTSPTTSTASTSVRSFSRSSESRSRWPRSGRSSATWHAGFRSAACGSGSVPPADIRPAEADTARGADGK